MKKIETACLIDDDPIFVFATKKIMQIANFCNHIITYNSGLDAINKLTAASLANQQLPEVILLDLNMPVMDGWQFLHEFVKIPSVKEIAIYILTSSIDQNDIDKAKSFNIVNKYLIKPISVGALNDILNDYKNN